MDSNDDHAASEEVDLPQQQFIGAEQMVNAGYVVKQSNLEPHKYLMSSYEMAAQTKTTSPKPWTSLELAKPSWGDDYPSRINPPEDPPKTFGAWARDTMKLTAIPFSRASDGKERRWTKISSVKKRKRLPVQDSIDIHEHLGLSMQKR